MTPNRRKRAYELIETSRQIADRLQNHSHQFNRDIPDEKRIQAIRDVLDKLERTSALSNPPLSEDRMFEARVRSIAVEAVAWLEAIMERREQPASGEGPNLRVVG